MASHIIFRSLFPVLHLGCWLADWMALCILLDKSFKLNYFRETCDGVELEASRFQKLPRKAALPFNCCCWSRRAIYSHPIAVGYRSVPVWLTDMNKMGRRKAYLLIVNGLHDMHPSQDALVAFTATLNDGLQGYGMHCWLQKKTLANRKKKRKGSGSIKSECAAASGSFALLLENSQFLSLLFAWMGSKWNVSYANIHELHEYYYREELLFLETYLKVRSRRTLQTFPST